MNIGEFIIKIGTQGDTKELEKAIKKLEEAEKKSRKLIKTKQALAKATDDEERALIKKNAAQQDELEKLKAAKTEHDALNTAMHKNIMTAVKFVGAFGATVTMLDRLGNSLLKANQMYITFGKTTSIPISRLNRMAGIAQMSGMGLSPEQVAGDLKSLEDKIFGFETMGENAQTFGMLGINPRGMSGDQLILSLRKSLKRKNYSGRAKSRMLSELGLSQEWINVLDMEDDKFNEYLKTSSKLQLDAKERKKLAEFTAKQQQNNMRWELAKQRLLISIMPMVQQIMEVTSKIALKVSTILEQNPKWLYVARDILLLLTGSAAIKNISGLINMFKGLGAVAGGGLLAKGVGGFIKKRAAGMLGGLAGGPVGAIFSIAMGIWTVVDLFKLFLGKEQQDENIPTPDPDEGSTRYQYHNVKSNMTNNFYNNPQPAKEAIQQLSAYHNLILAEQYR